MICLRNVFACLVLFSAVAVAVKWRDCGSKTGKIVNLIIPGCEKVDRCPLKHKTNQSVSIVFVPNVQVTKVDAKVYGQLGPVDVPFPLPNPDGCKNSNLTCPLQSGTQYVYTSTLYVDPKYPSIDVVVQWELLDQNSAEVVCFKVPVQIVSSSANSFREIIRIEQINF